jgi:hypothetical protein
MNAIQFKPNEPQVLSLRETSGSGVLDGFHVLYETSDGKLLQLPRPAAVKLNELDPAPGEEFTATKHQNGRDPQEWVFALTARSEQLRAAKEAEELAKATRRDLPGQLQASVLRQMPKTAKSAAQAPLDDPRGTGTYGPIPQVALAGRKTPPSRVSYRTALRDITMAVTGLLKESGEQWNDQAKQDLVSTAFIAAAKAGGIVFDFEVGEDAQ